MGKTTPPPRTLPVLLSFVDREARYAFVDEAYAEWFATPARDIVGRPVAEVVGEAAWAAIRPRVEAALAGEKVSFEQVIPYAGAGDRHVSADYIPRRADDGTVEGFYAVVRDVTERKVLEADLERARRMESIGTLASAIAHDFRNVLMGVHGMAAVARSAVGEGSPALRYLHEIQHAAQAGSDAVRHLLDFARPGLAGKSTVRLDAAVADTRRMLKQLLDEEVDLELDLQASDADVRCVPGQIAQVLLNLAMNARDAMPRGGALRVRTRCVHLGPEEARRHHGLEPGEFVLLSVQDTGVGMDEETLRQVLEPFFTTKEKGTGLGLFSVFGMVRRCGGHLEVTSRPEVGTTVEILLPRAASSERDTGVAKTVAEVPPLRVLVVEDEGLIRLAIRHYLEKRGCEVLEADDADAAMAAIREHPEIDLAVVDVSLGSSRGPALVERMSAEHGPLPVIYVSAYPKRMLVEDGHVDEHAIALEKPFDEEALIAAMDIVLGPTRPEIAIK